MLAWRQTYFSGCIGRKPAHEQHELRVAQHGVKSRMKRKPAHEQRKLRGVQHGVKSRVKRKPAHGVI